MRTRHDISNFLKFYVETRLTKTNVLGLIQAVVPKYDVTQYDTLFHYLLRAEVNLNGSVWLIATQVIHTVIHMKI